MSRSVRVLIVDDSSIARNILSDGLSRDPGIEVVGAAASPIEAERMIRRLLPDVLTLDFQMPGMNGVEYLVRIMKADPLPVIMVSAHTDRGAKVTLDALAAGALDFVMKPGAGSGTDLATMLRELRQKIKLASTVRIPRGRSAERAVRHPKPPAQGELGTISGCNLIAIGASTGGTEAIKDVVTRFPSDAPGVVIVQHMPAGFTEIFARRLDQLSKMSVKEAEDGDEIVRGRMLVAPGGLQCGIMKRNGHLIVECRKGDKVNGHCPSVEIMMMSAAQAAGKKAVGVMLTGMGNDGAKGMKAMRSAGAFTMAQDEATSIVFGMPGAAWKSGGAESLVPLEQIADKVLGHILVGV